VARASNRRSTLQEERERGVKEERREDDKERVGAEPVLIGRAPTSMAPYCSTRVPAGLVSFLSASRAGLGAGGSLGRHHTWRPSIHIGRNAQWRHVLVSIYENSFHEHLFVEKSLQKG
jgi:hypothetical protein